MSETDDQRNDRSRDERGNGARRDDGADRGRSADRSGTGRDAQSGGSAAGRDRRPDRGADGARGPRGGGYDRPARAVTTTVALLDVTTRDLPEDATIAHPGPTTVMPRATRIDARATERGMTARRPAGRRRTVPRREEIVARSRAGAAATARAVLSVTVDPVEIATSASATMVVRRVPAELGMDVHRGIDRIAPPVSGPPGLRAPDARPVTVADGPLRATVTIASAQAGPIVANVRIVADQPIVVRVARTVEVLLTVVGARIVAARLIVVATRIVAVALIAVVRLIAAGIQIVVADPSAVGRPIGEIARSVPSTGTAEAAPTVARVRIAADSRRAAAPTTEDPVADVRVAEVETIASNVS